MYQTDRPGHWAAAGPAQPRGPRPLRQPDQQALQGPLPEPVQAHLPVPGTQLHQATCKNK